MRNDQWIHGVTTLITAWRLLFAVVSELVLKLGANFAKIMIHIVTHPHRCVFVHVAWRGVHPRCSLSRLCRIGGTIPVLGPTSFRGVSLRCGILRALRSSNVNFYSSIAS